MFNVPPTAMGPQAHTASRISSYRLEEPGAKFGTLGYKASGLSTTPWPAPAAHHVIKVYNHDIFFFCFSKSINFSYRGKR